MSFTTRVLTWNIACLPKPWNSFGTKNPSDRKQSLLMYIKNLYPDILCLQEVFDSGVTNYLIRGLQSYGYKVITSDEEYGCCAPGCLKSLNIGFRGGLLIAYKGIRFEHTEARFYKYSSSTGEDSFSRKGVLHARLCSSEGTLDVFNTHMQANATYFCAGNGAQVRTKQLKELQKWLVEAEGAGTAIVAGDFNISPQQPEFAILETVLSGAYKNGFLPIDTSRSSSQWGKRIDYIFYFPKRNWGVVDTTSSEIYATDLSDHYALVDEFSFD